MIEKLRKRVFRSVLLSAAGVLFVILLGWNIINGYRLIQRRDHSIAAAERYFGPGEGRPFRPGGRGEGAFGPGDADGAPSGPGEGERPGLPPEFDGGELMIWETDGEGRTVLVSTPDIRAEILNTAGWSALAFGIACCFFALMARLIAARITAPVETAMERQKQFIADASHELKTPLTVIDANAEVLEKSVGKSKWLDYIKEQTARMSSLVSQMLVLSRLEAMPAESAAQTFDAAEVVMGSALPFESAAYERGMTLESDVPDTLMMKGAPEDVKQLTGILIDNAIRHAGPEGSISLSLGEGTMTGKRKEIPAAVLTVKNTGETIPADALPHLFERFYRADPSRAYEGESFGLGLAIAKTITEKHGGTIDVTSAEAVTTFTVRLPRGL